MKFAAFLSVALALMVACGGDSDNATPTTVAPTTVVTAPPNPRVAFAPLVGAMDRLLAAARDPSASPRAVGSVCVEVESAAQAARERVLPVVSGERLLSTADALTKVDRLMASCRGGQVTAIELANADTAVRMASDALAA